jgi:hypothetical protein
MSLTGSRGVTDLRTLLAGVSLVALTAACGSTVQTTSTVSTLGGGDGLTGPVAADGTPLGQSGAGSGLSDAGGAQAGGTTGAAAAPGGAVPGGSPAVPGAVRGPGGAPAAATIPPTGRGWDKSFVYIGVLTQKDVQAVASNVGAKGLDAGDQEGQAQAVVDDLNRRGGLFGRRVKIVFKDQGTVATAGDPNTQANAACTYFTQDHPVIAVLNPVTLLDVDSFRACLAKSRVALFSASVAAIDDKVGQQLAPYFYASVAPSWTALAPVLVQQLKAQGWLGGWNAQTGRPAPGSAKVGILTPDTATGQRVASEVSRALASAGAPGSVVYAYDPNNTSGSVQGSVLQFSGKGVTHVIVTDSNLLPFQTAASNQGYRPRYGITSYNAPQAFLESNSPAGQNNGAVGVGWSPSFDVSDANDPGDTGTGETECKRTLATGGQTFSGKRLAEAVAFAFCDGLRLIVQGAAAGGGLTGPQLYQGVLRIAPRFSSAFSFATGLTAQRLAVPGGVRPLAFVTACTCFRYASRTTTRL